MTTRDTIWPVLEGLLECAVEALDDPPPYAYISLGPIAYDCPEGQLWVRPIRVEPLTTQTGQPYRAGVGTGAGCGVLDWTVTIGVGIRRCEVRIGDGGEFPAAAAHTAEARRGSQDMMDLSGALRCCGPAFAKAGKLTVGEWTPHGPDLAAGGEWTVRLTAPACPCD